jgi:hypothetical protein
MIILGYLLICLLTPVQLTLLGLVIALVLEWAL